MPPAAVAPPALPGLHCRDRWLDLRRPQVMAVLNITPDSFSDGGRLWRDGRPDRERILRQAGALLAEGAAVLDVGGESTRPGATAPTDQQELDRVLPVIEWLRAECDALVSVDTSSAAVMRAAVAAGAGLINDVRALRRPGALAAAADLGVPVVLMHMQGEPATMQQAPAYADTVAEVRAFLQARIAACCEAGLDPARIVLDPGFGFGKTVGHNLQLLRQLDVLVADGWPVLAGLSRKSLIGHLTGRPVGERALGSAVLALEAARRGARLLRVHDVAATVEALTLWQAVEEGA